ncbi:serine/threonine protein kinase [Limnoglobus roseus]|uniref:Serine/threonine protein kinase n=1 Tax=Limnoglobus roseus TaxID=2598579 RepID=A0A5C1AR32_9BACT|nr:serine/threonine protein kinase [Limnoglobus roseus]
MFPVVVAVLLIGVVVLQRWVERWATSLETPPAVRVAIPTAAALAEIAADQDRTEPANRNGVRYLSLLHLHNNPQVTDSDLAAVRDALTAAERWLSDSDRPLRVVPVDKDQIVYRVNAVDLETATGRDWRWFLVRNPYGLTCENDAARPLDRKIRDATGDPVAFVRADWFLTALVRDDVPRPGVPDALAKLDRAYYARPIDADRAAAELGVPPAALTAALRAATGGELREEFGLAPLVEGRTVPREWWESDRYLVTPFQAAARRLGVGTPVRVR